MATKVALTTQKIASMVPPNSIEAEQSVLGSLLMDKEALIKIADFLGAEDFYQEQHQIIYQAILDLYQRHITIDVLTVANALEERGQLEASGGSSYLAELVDNVPTAAHIDQYAMIVKEKATRRKIIKAGHEVTGLGIREDSDITETLEKVERAVFQVSQSFIRNRFIHIKEILNESYERIAELHDKEGEDSLRGIATGFYDLDRKLSGLQRSDLVIIAGRPSMGKTALALNIAQNVAAKKGRVVGIFSLEMSKDQLVERMFCALLGVDSWKLRTGQLDQEDFERMGGVLDELSRANLFIDDAAGCNIIELRTKARRLQAEHGLDLLIIDYIQLMRSSTPNPNRVQEISEISRSLKMLARELNVPIIALSQLSRAVESRTDRQPQLSDLRESGSIEQDADVVLFLYRDDYYHPDTTDRPGITDLIISKHRTGPTGKVEVMFQKEKVRFVNLEKQRTETE